ncbi:MAG TPA: hypothetical protein OIM48_00965 [Clostridiaceae bacterium]|nr:hypothetical protein [Clostridiaceae bacterium]
MKKGNFNKKHKNDNLANNKKKIFNKVNKIEIKQQFLVIGLVAIITLISLIYFIFLKYSPVMNFKYEGYGVSGKQITENLLGAGNKDTSKESGLQNSNLSGNEEKNVSLSKIEEQGTIFKKLNSYFIGNKEKTEIDLSYPIYINDKNTIYNLNQDITLISKNFEQIAGYPNISITDGKVYNGNSLERADSKEYIFAKTEEGIYINLKEIKIGTTANEYVLPVNSLIVFEEDVIRYYSVQNNILMFNEIKDVDYNSQIIIKNIEEALDQNSQKVDKEYNYEELLTRLGIIENAKNDVEKEEIIEEDTIDDKQENNTESETEPTAPQDQKPENNEQTNAEYIKPEVTVEDFKAEVYTAKSNLNIKDQKARIIEAPTFEIYKDGKIYLRRVFKNSGEIQITGLVPETEYEIIGKYIYLNAENKKVENTFYKGTIKTKGYEALGTIELSKEEGEIYSNKIQIKNVKIISDLQNEAIKGINQIELETGNIKTVLKNNKVNELLEGKEVTIESSEGLKSNTKIEYVIKFYDKNGKELKVKNNKGKTRTSKQEPKVTVQIKEQDIVSVALGLKLTNKDNVKLENYKYIITRPNGEKLKEERLSEDEKEIRLEDLDQNQYYKIKVYADYDLGDNKGTQKDVEMGNLVFATKPISTLGSLEMIVENKELTSTNAKISYKIDEEKTDKRLIQILNELTIKIVETPQDSEDNVNEEENNDETGSKEHKNKKVIYTNTLTKEEIEKLQQGETKEISYENFKSNTKYTIEITGNVELGNTKEEVPVTYTYKEFTTLKIPAKILIQNQFVTGNLIDLDVRVKDEDNSVLNNKVRMELRDEKSNLIDLQEISTNEKYVRKTYEKLEENKTYKLSFYADQYNEGSTDETYKVNYLIKEIEIITEPGISGSIGLTELAKKATGKNLVDISSEIKWYVYPNFNTNDYYGKEYNKETKILTLGGHGNFRRAVYDLREYAEQEVTMSFKAKAVSGSQIAYIQNSKKDVNRTAIQGLTTEWKDYQYTLKIDSTGYLGFYMQGGSGIEVKELQIELGNKKTSYEEFKYNLQSSYSINLEDKRDEITTNDYYIKVYEDNNLVKEDRYEEIPEENVITNEIKTYKVEAGRQYKVELTIKMKEREYVISSLEYDTKETEEIKGIYNKEDFLEIQSRGHYIVLGDIDLEGGKSYQYKFGNQNLTFNGKINFNGYNIKRDAKNTIQPIFDTINEESVIENIKLEIKLNNMEEMKYFVGLVNYNYGTIRNIYIELSEANDLPNLSVYLVGWTNYGILDNFAVNLKESIYGNSSIATTYYFNYGTIKNGYVFGENIKANYRKSESTWRNIGGVLNYNYGNLENIFSLINVEFIGKELENNGNILANSYLRGKVKNIYSVGIGSIKDLTKGPTISWVENNNDTNIENSYYFSDTTFNSKGNRKTTPWALWNSTFQNQILNAEKAFNVDELITQGYYPQLNWPECMPLQEYINLPEVEDKDLPDILSVEVLESTKDIAKVKFSVNNPSAETITKIEVKNLTCTIESQQYNDGKSEVIAILNNPLICVSQYSVMKISTKGAYNQEYTREFKENERLIDVDFYREINTIDDWKNINKSPTENYMLMQDLDFRNNPYDSVISTECIGILDGNNHTIRNIENNRNSNVLGNQNEVRNIFFENISFLNADSWTGIISRVDKLENVYANNVKIIITKASQENVTQGGLVAHSKDEVKNCGVNNVTLINNTYSYRIRMGGLIGVANKSTISNCYATNIKIQTKNGTYYEGVGGLIGASETKSTFKDCYTTGTIETDGSSVGGLIGYINQGEIINSYSYVNITGNVTPIGGIVGSHSNTNKLINNISFGNMYTSQLNTKPARILGSGTLTNTNYAYSNQRINGLIETTTGANTKLLKPEELLTQSTYTNILNYGNAYDYSQLEENILPKLHKINEDGTYSNELLPNQEDVYLDISNELKIDSVEIEKSAVDQIAGQIVVINTNEVEITGVEIEGMDVTVTSILTRYGKSYINITAKPNKYYDTYKITKVKYKEGGIDKKQEVEGKIEVQFYKELYNFEDWQEIEEGTYQNYRLMSDIDFAGKTDVKTNVTMARLEGVGGIKTLKNIDLTFNTSENGLIKQITLNLENINFENISISNENDGNSLGIIVQNEGDISNIKFTQIEINASKMQYVGCISNNAGNIFNINLEDIQIHGNNYTGGFIGSTIETEITDINITDFTVFGYDYVGGIFGNITGGNLSYNIGSMKASEGTVKGNDCAGGIAGSGYGNNYQASQINVKGNSNVGGIMRTKSYKLQNFK